jgi:predicted dehydrogenase
MAQHPVGFGLIGVDHLHAYIMAKDLVAAGAVFKGWWTREQPADLDEVFDGAVQPLPDALRVSDYRRLLDDPTIELILVGAMPNERARLAVESLRAGKDVVTDKPAVTALEDLEQLRRAVAETSRFWSVNYSERYTVRAVLKAAELVEQGAIGKVVHTVGLGPHRGKFGRRPPWFFERATSGGILNDLGSHQIDHFVYFTRSTQARVIAASVGNFTLPDRPDFEDVGEALLQGESASGYVRVDWLTPDAQPHFGDNRLLLLGTEGTIEIRKYVDIGGQQGANHLLIARGAESERIDCADVPLRYFKNILRDVRERRSSAEPPGHSLRVSELTLRAQSMARMKVPAGL